MDSESFEQYTLPHGILGKATHFLVESETYKVFCANQTPVSLQLPDALVIEVKDTAPPAHGVGGASNILKEAVLASGLTIRVPMFIKTGDHVRIDTASEKYVGKESG
jgi:elongation factor P